MLGPSSRRAYFLNHYIHTLWKSWEQSLARLSSEYLSGRPFLGQTHLRHLSCSGVKKVLAVGERLSPCGKFAINSAGEWRELAGQDQVAKTPEMVAVDAEGKHIVQELK
jgi:hypothetical protein